MVTTYIEKDRGCSDENMEDISELIRKDRRIKLSWRDVIRKDMKETGVERSTHLEDRRTWRMKTYYADYKYGKGRRGGRDS